ncbi:uncharacterized protein LOC124296624 [Neodiprion lecontei]|uniref:Uncharacterized protein LOC124296624 n=1 Tax=Neodiprion lecontei TaxID=441921 RepID=A0ABM3GQU7_NEOLC|nr:uncharacterized protein LOC124296624 [Neodiprion lecontei]
MSQMLCEVINDEETFSKTPVKFAPCAGTKSKRTKHTPTFNKHGQFISQDNYERNVESISKKNDNNALVLSEEELEDSGFEESKAQQRNANFQSELKLVDDENDQHNVYVSCGWETEKSQTELPNKTYELNNCKESRTKIQPETQRIVTVNSSKLADKNFVDETNSPPFYGKKVNYSSRKPQIQETDVIQSQKNLETNEDSPNPSQNYSGKCISTRQKNFDNTKNTTYQDNIKAVKLPDDILSKEINYVRCPQSKKEFGNNIATHPSNVGHNTQSYYLEHIQPNFEINRTSHHINEPTPSMVRYRDAFNQQSQRAPEFFDDIIGNDNVSPTRYNACVQEFGGVRPAVLPIAPEEDKYEICPRFTIIIPNSDEEDQHLEIIGYEVRAINRQLSKYMLCPHSESEKKGMSTVECLCKTDTHAAYRNVNIDSARHSNIIKLDINHGRSKHNHAKKRFHNSGTAVERQFEDESEHQDMTKIGVQHKPSTSKGTQTDTSYENQIIQTIPDVQTGQPNRSKSVNNKDVSLMTTSLHYKDARLPTPYRNEPPIDQYSYAVNDDQVSGKPSCCAARPDIKNSSLPEASFNNTRILLNVIVKILEADSTQEVPINLQRTLNTMLDTFQQITTLPPAEVGYPEGNVNELEGAMNYDNTTDSTQYRFLPLNKPSKSQQVENKNSQESPAKIVKLDDSTENLRPQSPIERPVCLSGISEDETTMYLLPGEVNNAVNKDTSGNEQNPAVVTQKNQSTNETDTRLTQINEPSNEKNTRNVLQSRLPDHSNVSNSISDPILDYTSEFGGNGTIPSSSRNVSESLPASQLTKDFLDVVKYTIMMDQMLQPKENGNNECCKQPEKSTDSGHLRK